MLKKILTTAIIVGCGLILILLMQRQQQTPPARPVATPADTPAAPTPATHPDMTADFPAPPPGDASVPVVAATPDTPVATATPPARPLPARLDGSDPAVRQAAGELSPALAAWLIPAEQLRKWVALVNLVAEGRFPVKDRPLHYALEPFRARKEDNRFWLEPLSFQRKDALVRALTALSPQQVAAHFHAWEPLLQQAHDELGNGGRFRDRLLQVIDRVNRVQPLAGETELKVSIVSYQFQDPALEKASALEKLLWRAGPDNSRRLQDYLRTLKPLL